MTTDFPPISSYENLGTTEYEYDPYIPERDLPVPCMSRAVCATFVLTKILISFLGLCGNGMVIWIAGFRMKRTVNTIWYLSLAFSDFIFCATLPLSITRSIIEHWIFGLFMCKFISFVMFLNMFSSILLMVIISVDRSIVVVFPVWAQNHRTPKKARTAVVVAWIISMALSIPSLIFRDLYPDRDQVKCYNNFSLGLSNSHTSTVVTRFMLGFVLPLVVITVCYSVIMIKLWNNRMARTSKPFKIMTALIFIFLLSWLPYHITLFLEIKHNHIPAITHCIQVASILAEANSCMNPFLYAFMGEDFKKKFCGRSLISRIENALTDEKSSARTKSTDAQLSLQQLKTV